MAPEQHIYDADQARLVLENQQFIQAFADIEQEITEAWKASPHRDQEGRNELFRLLQSAKKFKSLLTTRLETGKLAQLQLQQEQALLTQDRAVNTSGWSSPYL